MATALVNVGVAIGGTLFGAAHKKAVEKENSVLGNAQPKFENELNSILNNFGAGMLSAATAKTQIDSALSAFQSDVSTIIKMDGQAGTTGIPTAGGHCNAACVIYHNYKKLAEDAKKRIDLQTSGQPGKTGGAYPATDPRGGPSGAQIGGTVGRSAAGVSEAGLLAGLGIPGLDPENSTSIAILAIGIVVSLFFYVLSTGRHEHRRR